MSTVKLSLKMKVKLLTLDRTASMKKGLSHVDFPKKEAVKIKEK